MIWFSLTIPIVVFFFTLFYFSRKLNWVEISVMLAVPVLIVVICKVTTESIQTRDVEYWGGWARNAEYYEDWDEYIHRTCTRSYPCGTDSNGNTEYCTETYDCSYVEYHPEYWVINGSNDETIHVSKQRFEELAKRWNNRQFVDMHRHYYTNDGDKYLTTWSQSRDTIEVVTTEHSWTNRVKASRSVFNFETVDPKTYGLFDHPAITDSYKQRNILGDESTTTIKADTDLAYYNATLGARKKLRCYILLFKDKPVQAGVAQQSFWKGGKKNEFIITIGIDKSFNTQWCYVFSWSDIEQLKVDAKDIVMSTKQLDLNKLVEWIGSECNKRFVKKNFRDFDYLSVDPPNWVIAFTFILTAIVSVVTAVISVKNNV